MLCSCEGMRGFREGSSSGWRGLVKEAGGGGGGGESG